MAEWTFWYKDYATEGTKTFSDITNGLNATSGRGSAVAQITTTEATIDWDFGSSSASIYGVMFWMNNIPNTATLQLFYYTSTWVQVGNTATFGDSVRAVYTFGTEGAINDSRWRVRILSASGKVFAGIGLLGGATKQREVLTVDPIYPIGRQFDAPISALEGSDGSYQEQRHGAPYQTLEFEIQYQAYQSNMEQVFLEPTYGNPGLIGPITVVDGNGASVTGSLIRPIGMDITHAGPRVKKRFRLRTWPYTQLD